MPRLFVPGFGALPSLYEPALADGWTVVESPSFRRAASLDSRLAALRRAVDRYAGPLTLAGHSMGAALAVGLAFEQPERIERLVLVAPAGLWLTLRAGAFTRVDYDRRSGRVRLHLAPRDRFTPAAVLDVTTTTESGRPYHAATPLTPDHGGWRIPIASSPITARSTPCAATSTGWRRGAAR